MFLMINSPRWFLLDDFPNEVWKPVPEFEEYYLVSNYGRIRSLVTNKILKLQQGIYWNVNLYKKGPNGKIRKYVNVHRLMAQIFIPNPGNKAQVNHKNGNKLTLHLSNLEWTTASENTQHAYNNGLTRLKTGAESPNAIPINQYTLDDKFIKTWGGATCVRNELGINKSNIIQCCKGRVKQAGGFKWKYAKECDRDGSKIL